MNVSIYIEKRECYILTLSDLDVNNPPKELLDNVHYKFIKCKILDFEIIKDTGAMGKFECFANVTPMETEDLPEWCEEDEFGRTPIEFLYHGNWFPVVELDDFF